LEGVAVNRSPLVLPRNLSIQDGVASEEFLCRSCASKKLSIVLDLGDTPLANAFLTREQLQRPEPRFPLKLALCTDCSLLQMTPSSFRTRC
jgi:Putative zinc binding domain